MTFPQVVNQFSGLNDTFYSGKAAGIIGTEDGTHRSDIAWLAQRAPGTLPTLSASPSHRSRRDQPARTPASLRGYPWVACASDHSGVICVAANRLIRVTRAL